MSHKIGFPYCMSHNLVNLFLNKGVHATGVSCCLLLLRVC